MFDPSPQARIFGLPPGVDFPATLVAGLKDRLKGHPPEAIARVDLIVNTRRMARRLRDIFDQGPPGFLPQIRLITDLNGLVPGLTAPKTVSPLERRLELANLVSALLKSDPSLAPRTSLYALSDSLAGLLDEMQGEGVDIEAITGLDVTDQSGHWARAQRFLGIVDQYLNRDNRAPDAEERQRTLVQRIAAHWRDTPLSHPVILAGSTGSRGTTAMFMQAVAKLPQGAVVLPGFDFEMPTAVWNDLDEALLAEDHPQYRFHKLMQMLDLPRAAITEWTTSDTPSRARNRLVSLSLRPAPVTDAWLREGKELKEVEEATADLTLLEAPSPRVEALTIALRMRQAVEDGQIAALITPDRMLTRQVTSALDRWGILPDDSAGTPLQLSPPGRFLRHIVGLFLQPLDAATLLTLLKHPLTHSSTSRNLHQLFTQQFEMRLRKDGLPFPDPTGILRIATRAAKDMREPDAFLAWAEWVASTFCGHHRKDSQNLSHWVLHHLNLVEAIAAGQEGTTEHELWQQKAGEKARTVMQELEDHAAFGAEMTASEYASLVGALLSAEEVRDRDAPRSDVMIWGTLEARVQGADLVILGGLNDGTWPEAPAPDPWLNRYMRLNAGLLLPERRIGLSAHDYQQAIAAPQVWLTRAIRSDEAETVPSRWLNRLGNLMNGLPNELGKASWEAMQTRGAWWLDQARALDEVTRTPSAQRPSPRPPVAARPRKLSVTEIKHLIRDPYAIYAKHTLDLRPINPLVQSPDAPMRGVILHEVMEAFVRDTVADPDLLTKSHLLDVARQVLEREAPWPAARAMWLARIERIADWFIDREVLRQQTATPVAFEDAAMGQHELADIGFTIFGFADRIDVTDQGTARVYDYKTGTPPTPKEQQFFDKQLLIEAALVEQGGFKEVPAMPVAEATYIGVGATPKEVRAPLDDEPPAEVLAGLRTLIATYLQAYQGFTSRRMVKTEDFAGDYDQLARFGEWDASDDAVPEDLT